MGSLVLSKTSPKFGQRTPTALPFDDLDPLPGRDILK
jgi:hypothetical protein